MFKHSCGAASLLLMASACGAPQVPLHVSPQRLTPPRTKVESYGNQTAFADGVSALSVVAFPVGLVTFPGGYLFASPTIHVVHGRPGAAAASFALRLVVPTVSFVGVAALADPTVFGGCSGEGPCGLVGGIAGLTAGIGAMVAVSAFDALVLAKQTVAVSGVPLARARWVPTLHVDPKSSSGQLGLGGRF